LRASNSIKVFLDASQDVISVRANLVNLSLETRTDLKAQITLYNRLSLVQKELGVSQSQIVNVIEGVGKAIGVTSTSALEARGSLIQLSQAFGQSIVRAEEINSILEGTPRIAKAIADGLGLTVARMRELVKEGKVSSTDFFIALQSQTDVLREEFENVEVTIGQGMTNLQTGVTTAVGTLLQLTGIQPAVAGALNALGKALANFAGGLPSINDNLKILIDERLGALATYFNTVGDLSDITVDRLNKRFESLGKGIEGVGSELFEKNKIFEIEVVPNTTDYIKVLEDRLKDIEGDIKEEIKSFNTRVAGSPQGALSKGAEEPFKKVVALREEQEKLQALLKREKEVIKQVTIFKKAQAEVDKEALKLVRDRASENDKLLQKRGEERRIAIEKNRLKKEQAPNRKRLKELVEEGVKAERLINKIRRNGTTISAKMLILLEKAHVKQKLGVSAAKEYFDTYGEKTGKALSEVDLLTESFSNLSDAERDAIKGVKELKKELEYGSLVDDLFKPIGTDDFLQETKDFETWVKKQEEKSNPLTTYIDELNNSLDATLILETATVKAFKSMEDALVTFITTGEMGFKDFANMAIAELTRIFVRSQIIAPLASTFGSMDLLGSLGNLLPFVQGGVVSGSNISQFSSSVLTGPTTFPDTKITPYAKGTALAGEDGYEGILPLTRIGGELGVNAEGMASKPPIINISIENNVADKAEANVTSSKDDLGNTVIGIVIDAAQRNVGGFGNIIQGVARRK